MPSSNERILKYIPKEFDTEIPRAAQSYLEKSPADEFALDELVKTRTRLAEREAETLEEKIESLALNRVKEIQEAAYKEAFDLGREEGRKQAYSAMSQEIQLRLDEFNKLTTSLGQLKTELMEQNESHFIKLLFHIASRLTQTTIEKDPELILNIVRSAVGLSQDEERVVVQISPTHYEFLEKLKKETAREFEFLKKIRLEAVQGLSTGGCVVETNYGEIDARLEVRVSQLWEQLSEHLFKVKPRISAA